MGITINVLVNTHVLFYSDTEKSIGVQSEEQEEVTTTKEDVEDASGEGEGEQ